MAPNRKTKKDDDSDRLYKLLRSVITGMDKKVDKVVDGQERHEGMLKTVNFRLGRLEAAAAVKQIVIHATVLMAEPTYL